MKTINEEALVTAVLNAKNMTQVMMNLKRADSSAGRKTIKKYIAKYEINISHFETAKERYERVLRPYQDKNIRIDNSNIFIENSTYLSGVNLKKRLFEDGLKERICEKCGQNEIWNGEKISLILDHINGIHNDNRIENLQILCPNCNATLLTHCRGSKGLIPKKIKKSIISVPKIILPKSSKIIVEKINAVNGEKISHYKNISLLQRKSIRPSYEQLVDEINELGYSGTGKKYGVSDNAIRKWIKHYMKY